MATGVYAHVRCAPDCECGKHRKQEWSAERRQTASIAAKARGNNHPDGCQCGWHLQQGKRAEDPSYGAIHMRLSRERGNPSYCWYCGCMDAAIYDWAYTGKGHIWGEGQGYSENLDDYIGLCRFCHQQFDKGLL
jgi:hypothetical protein